MGFFFYKMKHILLINLTKWFIRKALSVLFRRNQQVIQNLTQSQIEIKVISIYFLKPLNFSYPGKNKL